MGEDRVLNLQGVHNFRDFGGYRVVGGRRLRRGVLWRSGHHGDATDPDLDAIAALGLVSVFDLRGVKERRSCPCRRPAGFAADVHLAEDPVHSAAPHEAAAQSARPHDAVSMRETLRRNYETLAFRPEQIGMMRRYLPILAEGRGASLINCMAGKDRTGIAVALVQLAVGVHRDDVMADYLLTNSAGDVEARIAAGISRVVAISELRDEEALRVLMGVEPEYLETAFRAMTERCGSPEGFMREVLQLDDGLRDRLRMALIE